ncbi:tRNA (guanosine(46)-N7)-methyltransferase TrmB [Gammaproteobacteria bacterium]|nr:tRNA (guanosine(46)-N7)-methyltransferase TrmB [Gammaproteobacteria bacterium]MDC0421198.1 tRNA (guanosine(46)-N7)-methyltransferase TrmB [Gammaproteobacteria bacterium]MDC0536072.1 tRNA (guanosine(46)-N7)-methyltransferase TrmB [Gammaproteobacteria bacterium]MDC1149131.1 tRNA (guanosine(46)-N7)-methyltransferase TrmB [Gammaproteobacteria bacterium]MDC1170766.1 tRNA (guanosine(46)-N7)-methyltransferase TrmB [Gammaproteobacteria bacterium]|tara:strand:- start:10398 stop:11045 length:648 start_codon:yes stop_codon:yes gene_type:complete
MRHKFLPSFVQRKGRITKSQEKNLLSLQDYEISSCSEIHKAKNNFKKIILEIGFGNGENVFKFANSNRENLYIGSEVYMAGIGQLLGDVISYDLDNVRIVTGDIRMFLDEVTEPIFDHVVIICPDPWPKLKHHKRRMLNDDFLNLIHKTIKDDGHLFMSTDWENYAESIEEAINNNGGFIKLEDSIYQEADLTKFQQRAVSEGRKIYPFPLKKVS